MIILNSFSYFKVWNAGMGGTQKESSGIYFERTGTYLSYGWLAGPEPEWTPC